MTEILIKLYYECLEGNTENVTGVVDKTEASVRAMRNTPPLTKLLLPALVEMLRNEKKQVRSKRLLASSVIEASSASDTAVAEAALTMSNVDLAGQEEDDDDGWETVGKGKR